MYISLKTGHQVLPKKIWLPFIRKPNVYIQVPGAEAQGFALPGTAGPRLSRLHTHLPEWYNLPQVFNNFPFFLGVETYQGIYRLLQCTVPLRVLPSVLFRTTNFFFFLEKQKLKNYSTRARHNDESRSSKIMKVKYT